MSETLRVPRPDGPDLIGERWGRRGATPVVLLHAGVCDRRAWSGVAEALADDDLDLVAYDRRGYGETPPGDDAAFTHLADLVAVLDEAGFDRAVVVGNSMGGALALDLAISTADRVAALVLVAPAVSGMTDEDEDVKWQPDPATAALLGPLEAAEGSGDVDERVRLELHLWLDGPAQPEGRVGGDARALAAEMNRRILEHGAPEDWGDSRLDTWHRLTSIDVPAIVAWGEHDLPVDHHWYEQIARRLPAAQERLLHGVAHLPSLEQPAMVAALVREAVHGLR